MMCARHQEPRGGAHPRHKRLGPAALLAVLGLSAIMMWSPPSAAAAWSPAWTAVYDGGHHRTDEVTAIALDDSFLYIAGSANGGSVTGSDAFLAKLDRTTGTRPWSRRFDAGRSDIFTDVAVGAGGVFVAGAVTTARGDEDMLLLKYRRNGTKAWTNWWGGSAYRTDVAWDCAPGPKGSVYVAGLATIKGHGRDGVVARFGATGKLLWRRTFDTPAHRGDEFTCMAVDLAGNVYVAGDSNRGRGAGQDWILVKYSAQGKRLWVRRVDGGQRGFDYATDIAVRAGRVCVVGEVPEAAEGSDGFIGLWDTAGRPKWRMIVNGQPGGVDRLSEVLLDVAGNVVAAGCLSNAAGDWDVLTIKYSPVGAELWRDVQDHTQGGGDDWATDLTLDPEGGIHVAATMTSETDGLEWGHLMYLPAGGEPADLEYWGGQAADGANCLVATKRHTYLAGWSATGTATRVDAVAIDIAR